jgi:hypothetical protein
MSRLRSLLVALGVLAGSAPLEAAITAVSGQEATATGNDATITLPGATTIGNVVLVGVVVTSTGNTVTLDDITETEVTLHGPADHNGERGYLFCYVVTAADATIVVTTSGSAAARSWAKEFTGISTCTEQGTSSGNATTGTTSHSLTTGITTTGEVIVASIIKSSSAANFSNGAGMTCIPSTCTDFGGTADTLGGYRIETANSTYDTPFTSAASEDTILIAAAVGTGSGGGGTSAHRLLLRCCDR